MLHRVLLLVFLLVAFAAQAQSPRPLPRLDLRVNGSVNALVRTGDGGIVLGGAFVSVDGVARANLARLGADGTVDATWNPGADGAIRTLAVDASGRIYVGGQFTQIGGVARNFAARLSSSGVVDAAWNPAPNGSVYVLQPDAATGFVYMAGTFISVGADAGAGTTHPRLARYFAAQDTAALDSAWNPAPDAGVFALAVYASGVYVGGQFATIGGQARKGLARLAQSGNGAADPAWSPTVDAGISPYFVLALALDGNGSIYVGGAFSKVNGVARSGFAKLSTIDAGSLQTAWNPPTSSDINALLLDGNYVYLGGAGVSIGGVQIPTLMRAAVAGTADAGWNPAADGPVQTLLADGSGGVYAGGILRGIGGQQQYGFAHLDSAAALLPSANVESAPAVIAMVKQHNGGTIVAGAFLRAEGMLRKGVLRLRADDSLDPDWQVAFDAAPSQLAVDSADDVFALGNFASVDGQFRAGLAKLSGSGSGGVDTDWAPNVGPGNTPRAIAIAANDAVYIGGWTFLGKFSNTGTGARDASWNPAPNDQVRALAIDGSTLYVSGIFTTIAGQPMARLARFDIAGAPTLDASWHPAPSFVSNTITLDTAHGWLYGGGASLGAAQILRRVALADGSVDPMWNPPPPPYPDASLHQVSGIVVEPNGDVIAASANLAANSPGALQKISGSGSGDVDANWNPAPDGAINALLSDVAGKFYVGGNFTTLGGQPRRAIAAFADPEIIFADGFDAP